MSGVIEVPTFEGLLCWDGRVVELFRSDGRQGHWRLHAGLVRSVELERRRDRILVKFNVTDRFYESAEVPLEHEEDLTPVVTAVESTG